MMRIQYVTLGLGVLSVLLLCWLVHLKIQIRSLCRQLQKRLDDGTRTALCTSLFDRDTMTLTAQINRCFAADEKTKSALEREEKTFRSTIANISHDLRTPLTSVKGYLQLLSATRLDEVQQQRLHIIQKHTNELGDFIEHFFEYSILLSEDTQLMPEHFSLTDEAAECLAAAVPQLEEKHLSVRLERFEQVRILADREKTVRILQNLVRNCIQHSAGEIAVNIMQEQQEAVVAITNPVQNPDEIEVSRLFERFYTAEKAHRRSTGLGLSIVQLLAEQLGGSVSAQLDGSLLTIAVRLPCNA